MRKLLMLFALGFLFSCGSEVEESKSEVKALANLGDSEIVVVCPPKYWNSELSSTFQLVFEGAYPGLFKKEKEFDLITVSPIKFSSLLKKQALIFDVDISPEHDLSQVFYQEDRYADGQLYVKLKSPTVEDATLYLLSMQDNLKSKLYHFALDFRQNKIQYSKVSLDQFKGRLSSISIPKGFSKVSESDNHVYFGKRGKGLCESGRNTTCSYQMGILISKYPFKDSKQLERPFFLAYRDSLTKEVILGPEKGEPTYMKVESSFPVVQKNGSVDGRYVNTFRGWWDMTGATMGGPFLSFQLASEDNQDIYQLDAFVFAPNFKKKKFLIELEASLRSITQQLK